MMESVFNEPNNIQDFLQILGDLVHMEQRRIYSQNLNESHVENSNNSVIVGNSNDSVIVENPNNTESLNELIEGLEHIEAINNARARAIEQNLIGNTNDGTASNHIIRNIQSQNENGSTFSANNNDEQATIQTQANNVNVSATPNSTRISNSTRNESNEESANGVESDEEQQRRIILRIMNAVNRRNGVPDQDFIPHDIAGILFCSQGQQRRLRFRWNPDAPSLTSERTSTRPEHPRNLVGEQLSTLLASLESTYNNRTSNSNRSPIHENNRGNSSLQLDTNQNRNLRSVNSTVEHPNENVNSNSNRNPVHENDRGNSSLQFDTNQNRNLRSVNSTVEHPNENVNSNLSENQQFNENDSSKKRKRTSVKYEEEIASKKSNIVDNEVDDDDGKTCSICLDDWEMSGPHRLTALKCGHLFGNSCIRRWLQQQTASTRSCPSCKTRATLRDLRFIYAKRVCAVDKTEVYDLQEKLQTKITEYEELIDAHALCEYKLETANSRIKCLEMEIEKLKSLRELSNDIPTCSTAKQNRNLLKYRLYKERRIDICKDPGCRVMLYAPLSKYLIVSQKSSQNLFPGYGIRFIDVDQFRPMNFLHVASKSIRDFCMSASEDLLLSATQEHCAKLYNVSYRSVTNVFKSDKPLWSCALDREHGKYAYLGSQSGTTYIYDLRDSQSFIHELNNAANDLSPVINICSIFTSDIFPMGGLLVCQLQSISFYECITAQPAYDTIKLNIDGPFVSMSYDENSGNVLISTRPCSKYSTSRIIIGKLTKVFGNTTFTVSHTFHGSSNMNVMCRCSQITMQDTTLIAAYLQDVKLLSVWDCERNSRIQSVSVPEIVYDTCPVFNDNSSYLAALSESKCRIYKITTVP